MECCTSKIHQLISVINKSRLKHTDMVIYINNTVEANALSSLMEVLINCKKKGDRVKQQTLYHNWREGFLMR